MLAGQTVEVVSEAPATNEQPRQSQNNNAVAKNDNQTNWERSQLPSAGHGTNDNV